MKRHTGLYNGLKSEQEQQTRDLEAVSLQKADQDQVDVLRGETTEIKNQVTRAHSQIAGLQEMSTQNRSHIEGNRETLSATRQQADTNAAQLSEVKYSLERERYNFELQKKGGVMKLFNIFLRLKDVDVGKQRYDLEIIADKRRLKKRHRYLNEPIYFYLAGTQQPYEVVVTKIDKKYVVGYLSVPKLATGGKG